GDSHGNEASAQTTFRRPPRRAAGGGADRAGPLALVAGGGGRGPSRRGGGAARPAAGQPEPVRSRSWRARPLPLIGRLSTAKQLQVLTTALVAFLVIDAAVVAYDTRQGTFATLYVSTVGKIRMLSQRLAKAAQQASQGNGEAFKQLRDSRDEFGKSVKLLLVGGIASGVDLPASPQGVRAQLAT